MDLNKQVLAYNKRERYFFLLSQPMHWALLCQYSKKHYEIHVGTYSGVLVQLGKIGISLV